MKAILKYPGAKNRLAEWICSFIPEHKVYVEPYFGSGAVFFNKTPARIETINDLDGEVVNYFRTLRENSEELTSMIRLTPFSRDEYYNSFIVNENDTNVERARKFAVRCWQGFGSGNVYRNGFRSSQRGTSPHTTKEWGNLPERLIKAGERLKNAQIENLPAMEILKRYDTADVFIYVDPPYLHGTRKNYLYKHEMNNQEHIELLEVLTRHPGKIMISGYDNELYCEMLSGWHKVQKKTQAEAGLPRIETIWMNYQINQQLDLFKEGADHDQ